VQIILLHYQKRAGKFGVNGSIGITVVSQIPHISPLPPMLPTSTKVAKQGAYMRDTAVIGN